MANAVQQSMRRPPRRGAAAGPRQIAAWIATGMRPVMTMWEVLSIVVASSPPRRRLVALPRHNRTVTLLRVNCKQFKKWLAEQGATFEAGEGGHLKVFLNGKRSVLPMGSGELKKGTAEGIKKQLGLKE